MSGTRIFLRTLQIYLAPGAGDPGVLAIWCEPSWHLRASSGIVTGSGAIEAPDSYDNDAEVARADATITRASDIADEILVGQSLEALDVDPLTFALSARFSGGIVAATFADDPECDAMWVLRDQAHGIAIRGTAAGIAAGSRAPRPDRPLDSTRPR